MKAKLIAKHPALAFLLSALVFLVLPLEAEDALAELFAGSYFKAGLLPNFDGLLDANLDTAWQWSRGLGSALKAEYLTTSRDTTESGDNSKFSAKVFSRTYEIQATVLEYRYPGWRLPFGQLGLSAGFLAQYDLARQSISGYKTSSDGTLYFNQDKILHTIIPTARVRAACAVKPGDSPLAFNTSLHGAWLPWVLLLESGSKLYSSYEEAIPYSLVNHCMGWQAGIRIETRDFPWLDFDLNADFGGIYGHYGSRQDIVSGNYRTTILSWDEYRKFTVDGQLSVYLSFLSRWLSIVPAVTVGYNHSSETLDGRTAGSKDSWKTGLSISAAR